MLTVGTYEAKTHLAELLAKVERGETITITRNGKPVARLVPSGLTSEERKRARKAIVGLKKLKSSIARRGGKSPSTRELIDEGRRY